MKSDQEIKDLLRQLRAVANDERCPDGERDNARRLYEKTLRRNDLTDADINVEISLVGFRYDSPLEKRLLNQIIGHETDGSRIESWTKRYVSHTVFYKLTETQAESVRNQFKIYKKSLAKEHELFYSAFVQKNDLGVKSKDPHKELTADELAEIRAMLAYMEAIKKTPVYKAGAKLLTGVKQK